MALDQVMLNLKPVFAMVWRLVHSLWGLCWFVDRHEKADERLTGVRVCMGPVSVRDCRDSRCKDGDFALNLKREPASKNVDEFAGAAIMAGCLKALARLQLPSPHLKHIRPCGSRQQYCRTATRAGP